MAIIELCNVDHFQTKFTSQQQSQAVDALELGKVLLFPRLPFELMAQENQFLTANAVAPKQKNISYNGRANKLQGDAYHDREHQELQAMMARFANSARTLIEGLFPHYKEQLQQARTSYRVIEARDRNELSLRKDDRRLHVDAFPSSPTQGRRILRVFSNINPNGEPRVWRIGGEFSLIANRYAAQLRGGFRWKRRLLHAARITKGLRTDYDDFMLQLHDKMKKDESLQNDKAIQEVRLPARSTWMVFTDQVSHAAMSGQFCLEQTFHFPVSSMSYPERAPLSVLQQLFARELT